MRLITDGLLRDIGDIRLLVCWSGLGRRGEVPFAGQLSAAMKNRGFHRVIITGYTGAIEMLASASNLIISSGFNPHGPAVNAMQGATVDGGGAVPGVANVGDETRSLTQLVMARGSAAGLGPNKTVWY
ncbi:MAG: hypothetical protein V4488_07095 [Pseudomonadota bacterium]